MLYVCTYETNFLKLLLILTHKGYQGKMAIWLTIVRIGVVLLTKYYAARIETSKFLPPVGFATYFSAFAPFSPFSLFRVF